MKLSGVKELFRDVNSVLAQLQVQPGMHHIAWKVLSSDLKVHTDAVLRRLTMIATDAAEASGFFSLSYSVGLCMAKD